jgi:hypothetical protein
LSFGSPLRLPCHPTYATAARKSKRLPRRHRSLEGIVLVCADGHRVQVENGVQPMIDDDTKVKGNLTGGAVALDVGLGRLMRHTGPAAGGGRAVAQPEPAIAPDIDRKRGPSPHATWMWGGPSRSAAVPQSGG